MTAEHQSGAGYKAVCKMLPALAKKKRLSALSATISAAPDAKTALDALLTVDTVGPFFAWQIFCDLASVAPVEPDALPARVIKDSQTNYAIFGPGAAPVWKSYFGRPTPSTRRAHEGSRIT